MTESICRYSGSGNIFFFFFFFFSFFCLVPSLLYPAFIIGPHRYPKAGGGHGGRAKRLPPKEHRKNSVLALIRFVSLLFLCALLLLFSLLFFLLLLVLVSGVVCLVLCLKHYPTNFPRLVGGMGGRAQRLPPKNTGRTAFWLWSVSFRFFSFVPCYCCSCCCSSFFFLFLCDVVCLVLCLKHYPT